MKAAIICLALMIILNPCAYSKHRLNCGDELRIETYFGDTLQGKLQQNVGDSLALISSKYELYTIALNNVKSAFLVKRETKKVTQTGLKIGAILGIVAAIIWYNKRGNTCEDSNRFLCYDSRIVECPLIVAGGIALGAIVGNMVGQNSYKLREVRLEALPDCLPPLGDKIHVKLSFAINF